MPNTGRDECTNTGCDVCQDTEHDKGANTGCNVPKHRNRNEADSDKRQPLLTTRWQRLVKYMITKNNFIVTRGRPPIEKFRHQDQKFGGSNFVLRSLCICVTIKQSISAIRLLSNPACNLQPQTTPSRAHPPPLEVRDLTIGGVPVTRENLRWNNTPSQALLEDAQDCDW